MAGAGLALACVFAALVLLLTAAETVAQPAATASSKAAETQRLRLLAGVKSWGYQLRQLKFDELAASPFDLLVIDHALSVMRRFQHEFDRERLGPVKIKPDGSRRLLLAYLSIGEAERYRFYWREDWEKSPPAWLAEENKEWPGNYNVRFWDPEWQRIIFGTPESYLERMIRAGFDGVYIDRADVSLEWQKSRPTAEAEMVKLLTSLAAHARRIDPHFLIIMQNAEELLASAEVMSAIDGLAKEDLFYGIDHKASPNDKETVDWTIEALAPLRRSGRRILLVEYLDDPAKIADVIARARLHDYVVHFTVRDLGVLSTTPPSAPRAAAPGAPALPPPTRVP